MIPELYQEYRPNSIENARWGGTGRSADFTHPIDLGKTRGPEFGWSYFNPGRIDAKLAPEDFRVKLHEIDPRLEVSWHPLYERWVLFFRAPHIQHALSRGWARITICQYPDGTYMPLDQRLLAIAWDRSGRKNGNGKQYFDRILSEIRRDYVTKEKDHEDMVEQVAHDRWQYAKIKNIGLGSKFANHEAAD